MSRAMQLDVVGNGPPIVFVGDGLTGLLAWAAHAQRLAPHRQVARAQPLCVQYALEGVLPSPYSIRLESQALVAALDRLSWTQPVDLVGWSSGGFIALDLALEHPTRVRTLTLAEPSAFWVLPDHGRSDPAISALESMERRWAHGVTDDDLVEFLLDARLVRADRPPTTHPQWPIWSRHKQALAAWVVEFDHQDDIERLRALELPVLLVSGRDTPAYFAAIVDRLAQLIPGARHVELPGGHAAPLGAIDLFLHTLGQFTG